MPRFLALNLWLDQFIWMNSSYFRNISFKMLRKEKLYRLEALFESNWKFEAFHLISICLFNLFFLVYVFVIMDINSIYSLFLARKVTLFYSNFNQTTRSCGLKRKNKIFKTHFHFLFIHFCLNEYYWIFFKVVFNYGTHNTFVWTSY